MPNGDLYQQSTNLDLLTNYIEAQAQLEIIAKNLQSIASPISARRIAAGSGSLYAIAARQDVYGDATKWQVIADANGLTDPEITGFIDLIIPVITNQNST